MSSPPVYVYRDAPLWRAARAMDENNCGFLPVVQHGIALGVVTSGDLARAATLKGRCPYSTQVGEIMSSPPVSIATTAAVREAMDLMQERGVHRLVVVDEKGILRGVLSLCDLAGVANDEAVAGTLHRLSESSGPVASGPRDSWKPAFFMA